MTTPTESSNTQQMFLYLGSLTLLVSVARPDGILFAIPASYMLKNQLHATATQVSTFWLLASIPIYVALVFGLMRDLWNPLGRRDRGFFLLFAPMTAITFLWMTLLRLSYHGLLFSVLLVMLLFQFIVAGQLGLISLLGQEKLMSGRLSALWSVIGVVPVVAAAFASGYITEHLPPRQTFLLMAILSLLIACIALWKPRSVFAHAYEKPQARGTDLPGDLRRLVKHRAIYPVVLILFLWFFVPGPGTPLQFYLTNQLHASDAVWSYFGGILSASTIPAYLLYGYFCKKAPLNKLLCWGTIIAVPGLIPLAFIHSTTLALLLATMGLTWGFAHASYFDLAMRSCPPGLQGTLMMLIAGVAALSGNGGNVLGSRIYSSSSTHGFLYCVIAGSLTTALILPSILLVPKELIATADGEQNPAVEAAMIAEIGEGWR
ncbi:MAG: MFS transporter [Deltaproteobacteria bacterium]|nr:MFS transporter [Deltaproteobacteria bacterium]